MSDVIPGSFPLLVSDPELQAQVLPKTPGPLFRARSDLNVVLPGVGTISKVTKMSI